MGRYIYTYRNNQTTDLESAVGTIATIGLLNLIPEPTLAWKCEITDTLCNLGTEGDWEPTKDMAHDSAWHAIQELISEREEEQRQQQARKKQTRPDEDSDLTTVLIKWGIYIALFFGAVWLAFAIVLPLLLLDAALVLLICGLVWKENAKIFFALAIAGIIYLLFDVHFAGLSASLVARAVFFQTVITAAVYINIAAYMVATYLLFRNTPDVGNNEFSKRNLIIMGAVALTGVGMVCIYLFVPSTINVAAPSQQTYVVPAAPVQAAQPAQAASIPGPAKSVAADSAKMADSAKAVDSAKASVVMAAAIIQVDTAQIKADLIGRIKNLQYSDQLSSVNQIKATEISDRINSPNGFTIHANLTFSPANRGKVEINYLVENGRLTFSSARLTELTKLVTVPADGWARMTSPVGFSMRFSDDSRMNWKCFDGGQVYPTGADVGPVTLPTSNSYLISSRGDGPLAFSVVFTPIPGN